MLSEKEIILPENSPNKEESREQPEEQSEEINFHQIARERAELRHSLNSLESAESSPEIKAITEKLEEELEDIDQEAKKFSIKEMGGLTEAKKRLRKQKEESEKSAWIDEDSIGRELGPVYNELSKKTEGLENITDFEMARLRGAAQSSYARRVNERILQSVAESKNKLSQEINTIEEENPDIFRAFSLISYKKGLHREGHIASVPSVEKYRYQIGVRMISGKPMFIHGPTGTGKTSIARNSAEHFTGQKPEMVYCNPQTREASIWGKTGLRPSEGEAGKHGAFETVDIYGPLSRAAKEGKVVIFDEFTALPKEQQVFIKGLMNAKSGDTVNIMGNGVTAIKPGFQMIFTANLKSEKNPERQDLPPEIAREFEQNNLEVNYTSPEESYDIMLARLMNPDGSIDLSYHDLNITLPQFTKAMAEIQRAYTDKESEEIARLTGTMDASGKRPGLKKLVLTQSTVENIIDAWKIEKQTNLKHPSFAEFLDQRLKTALTFKEYPQADRVLAAKILAAKGFLRTVAPQDLDLPHDSFNFDAANRLRSNKEAIQELKDQSAKEAHISLKELAQLDTFNKKQKNMAEAAKEFLPEEEQEDVQFGPRQEIQSNKDFIKEIFKRWVVKDDKISESEPNMKAETISPDSLNWEQRKQDIDASKSGEYTLNPDTQNLNFDRAKIKTEKLPKNMEGKSLVEVGEYATDTYGSKYRIPGLEYWKYILENPNQAPQELKDGNYHFLFGSILRSSFGDWHVPCVSWHGSEFNPRARWLGLGWDPHYRVILLEK